MSIFGKELEKIREISKYESCFMYLNLELLDMK